MVPKTIFLTCQNLIERRKLGLQFLVHTPNLIREIPKMVFLISKFIM